MAHSEAARPLAELGSGARKKLGKLAAVDARDAVSSAISVVHPPASRNPASRSYRLTASSRPSESLWTSGKGSHRVSQRREVVLPSRTEWDALRPVIHLR